MDVIFSITERESSNTYNNNLESVLRFERERERERQIAFKVNPCIGFYKPKCNGNDTKTYDSLHDDLKTLLNRKTLSLVGDSLSRQWFETLSCFFKLTQHWFLQKNNHTNNTHNAEKAGITPLVRPPKGASTVFGYATAFSISDESFRINYYHLERYEPKVLPYLQQQSDIIVINIGVHYYEQDQYQMDLKYLFEQCSNQMDETICLFLETLPQHFIYNITSNEEQDGVYSKTLHSKRKHHCGKISNNTRLWYNQIARQLANHSNINVVEVEQTLKPLWSYHIGTDCTHYCSNNFVWHNLNKSLLSALQKIQQES